MPDRGRRRPCPSCPPCSGPPGTGLAASGAVPLGERRGRQRQIRPAQGGHSVPPRPVLHLCGRLPARPPAAASSPPGWSSRAGTGTSRGSAWSGRPTAPSSSPGCWSRSRGAPFQRPLSPPPIEAGEPPEGFCIPVRLRFSPALAYRVYDEFDEGCVTLRGGRQPRGVGELSGGSVALWLSALLWSGSGGVGTGAPAETAGAVGGKNGGPPRKSMTRGVRITVIGWSHLNHRRNLT